MKTIIIDGKTYEIRRTKAKTPFLSKEIKRSGLRYKEEDCAIFINGNKEELLERCENEGYEPLWFGFNCDDSLNDNYGHNVIGCVFGVKKK
jgi:hypothetical protein